MSTRALRPLRAGATAVAMAPPQALWRAVTAIGGANGYHALDVLWQLRATLDRWVGGTGMGQGRRHPQELVPGERFDCWTVVALLPERHLALRFGMRAPGQGLLVFDLAPLPGPAEAAALGHAPPRTALTVTASWQPRGGWGLAYWYAMAPAHGLLFPRMAAALARRAEALDLADRAAL